MYFNDLVFVIENFLPNPSRFTERAFQPWRPGTSYQYRRSPFGNSVQCSNFLSLRARVLTLIASMKRLTLQGSVQF